MKAPPTGDWLHEPKLDGWRCIAVKRGKDVVLYSRHGKDITQRFKAVAEAIRGLAGKSLTLDGELVVAGEEGIDFYGLLGKTRAGAVLMAFDILERDGKDLRPLPLIERKAHLLKALAKARGGLVAVVPTFDDGAQLLAAAAEIKLEGVVSKRRKSPYRSGRTGDWVKVKTSGWTDANRERWRHFER